MTTEPNPNPSGAPAPPQLDPQLDPQPQPHGSGAAGDFDSAVRRDDVVHAERADALSTSEIHAAAKKLLDDSKSAYWTGSGQEHDYAVATVFRSRELAAAAEGNATDLPTSARIANRNLQQAFPKELGSDPRRMDQDADLGNFIRYADSEALPTHLVSRMMTSYANAIAATGQVSEEAIASMEREFAGELHPQQRELLKKWIRMELNENLRKLRRK